MDNVVDLGFEQFKATVKKNEQEAKAYGVPTHVYIVYQIAKGMQRNAPLKYKPFPKRLPDDFPDFPAWLAGERLVPVPGQSQMAVQADSKGKVAVGFGRFGDSILRLTAVQL